MIVFFTAVAIGWILTALVRWACFKWQVFDLPNSRSAHSKPTPTLGGVALVVGFWVLLVIQHFMVVPVPRFVYGLCVASVVLCVLVRDEIQEMGWLQKLGVQIVASVVMVLSGVSFESVSVGAFVFELGMWGTFATVIFLVTLQNLYNFMDGLDGFAALEGVLVAGFLGALFLGETSAVFYLLMGVCGITLGFWFWNKPPARIFMGDVGAHFLPLCFGVVAIQGASTGAVPVAVAMLPLGVFLFDAVYTLVRRLFRGENITQAHRFHLYQRLQTLGWMAWAINGIYALCTVLLAVSALSLQSGLHAVGYGVLAGTVLIMVAGTVCIEWRFSNIEQ